MRTSTGPTSICSHYKAHLIGLYSILQMVPNLNQLKEILSTYYEILTQLNWCWEIWSIIYTHEVILLIYLCLGDEDYEIVSDVLDSTGESICLLILVQLLKRLEIGGEMFFLLWDINLLVLGQENYYTHYDILKVNTISKSWFYWHRLLQIAVDCPYVRLYLAQLSIKPGITTYILISITYNLQLWYQLWQPSDPGVWIWCHV